MKKTRKKGFTIVELVIVIAVIAILATVLIPTFSGMIKRANRSSDTQLVRNLNMAVTIDLAGTGSAQHSTMYDAVEACVKQGYRADVITAKSDFNIAWETTTGHFVLLDMENGVVIFPANAENIEEYKVENKSDYFVVTKSSQYTKSGFKGDYADYAVYAYNDGGWPANISINKGFDAGEVAEIKEIIYENKTDASNAQNVIIRTSSYETALRIDAPYDTISHYGNVGHVNIVAVADHSYIEYGDGGIVQVSDGHIIITANSDIKKIHFTKAEKENPSDPDRFEDITVTIRDGAKLPEMSRDSVEIKNDDEIKVCTVETTEKIEDVVLSKQGVVEQVKLVSSDKEERYAEYVENPTEEADKQNSVAVMLANELNGINRDENGTITNCVITNKDGETVTSVVEITFDYKTREFVVNQTQGEKLSEQELETILEERIVDSGKDAADLVKESGKEKETKVWNGTVDTAWYDETKNEFVITTAEELAGLSKLVNDGKTFEGKTVKLGNNIDLNKDFNINETDEGWNIWTAIGYAYGSYDPRKPFSGTFDGQGYSILHLYRRCYNTIEYKTDMYGAIYPYALFGCIKNATIKNLTIDGEYLAGEKDIWYTNAMGGFVGVAFGDCTFESLTLKNSYLCGYISNCGGIVGGCSSGNMTFNNISVDRTNILTTWYNACDTQIGGIIGSVDIQDNYPDANHTNINGLYTTHISITNCYVACQLMPICDVMSNYAWYRFRASGMLIGGFTHNNSDGLWNKCDNATDEMLKNALTCSNVSVIYDLWNQQIYCRNKVSDPNKPYSGGHAGEFTKRDNNSVDINNGTHADGCSGEHDYMVFDQLIGGWSGGTGRHETGNDIEAYSGVIVTYLNGSKPTK